MHGTTRVSVTVLGDGGWGTALSIHLNRLGHHVRWWGAFPAYLRELDRRRENRKFLPGIPIPQAVQLIPQLDEAVARSQLIVLAIPSQHLRRIARRVAPFATTAPGALFLSAAKGLEHRSLKRMSQVLAEELGPRPLAVLSGPSIASEVARDQPASVVVASTSRKVAATVQRWCMSERFRLYTSDDLIGVELGGALKNPMAIGAGIASGLGFGSNAKAALITRGIVEMSRLGVAMGARRETFWGLSGLGDLITTCFAGRNHWLGEQLGRGRSLREVLASTPMVIEGVETAKAAVALGRRHHVELPIIEQVEAILFHRRPPLRALQALMARSGKSES